MTLLTENRDAVESYSEYLAGEFGAEIAAAYLDAADTEGVTSVDAREMVFGDHPTRLFVSGSMTLTDVAAIAREYDLKFEHGAATTYMPTYRLTEKTGESGC